MKPQFHLPSIAFCSAVLLTLLALPARAEFKCDGRQQSRVDTTACAHAAQGPDSLRRFITRTEPIYGLQMRDYARFVGDEPLPPQVRVAAAQATKPASVAGVVPPSR